MLFSDGGLVVVQKSSLGGYTITVPTQKLDVLESQLDSSDINYEVEENYLNIDDMNEDMPTASVLMFSPHVDVEKLQRILDHID